MTWPCWNLLGLLPTWGTRGGRTVSGIILKRVSKAAAADRDSLALIKSIDRDALSGADQVNYDLLLDGLERNVRSQRFPSQYLQMNQMGGPQQNLASLLAMMPNARAEQLENQIARWKAFPDYIDQNIALMRKGLEKGVTPPKITLREVPQQIRNQLVDDAAESPLLKGFVEIPATVDPLQADTCASRAAEVYRVQVVPAYEKLLEFTESEYLPGARESIAARDWPDGEAWYTEQCGAADHH